MRGRAVGARPWQGAAEVAQPLRVRLLQAGAAAARVLAVAVSERQCDIEFPSRKLAVLCSLAKLCAGLQSLISRETRA